MITVNTKNKAEIGGFKDCTCSKFTLQQQSQRNVLHMCIHEVKPLLFSP